MPNLVEPHTIRGSLSRAPQPIRDMATLRPWRVGDAALVVQAYHDPLIRRRHVRRADTTDQRIALK